MKDALSVMLRKACAALVRRAHNLGAERRPFQSASLSSRSERSVVAVVIPNSSNSAAVFWAVWGCISVVKLALLCATVGVDRGEVGEIHGPILANGGIRLFRLETNRGLLISRGTAYNFTAAKQTTDPNGYASKRDYGIVASVSWRAAHSRTRSLTICSSTFASMEILIIWWFMVNGTDWCRKGNQ